MKRFILTRNLLVACAALIVGIMAVPFQAVAAEDTLVIVTSYPTDTTVTVKAAFEKKHPGITVEILNKKTSAGIKYLQETAGNNQSDMFWASAPDAFEVLKGDDLLQKYQVKVKGIPEKVGSFPINDPGRLLQGLCRLGLWHHVEHPLHQGQEATRSQGMVGPQETGLFWPCGHECAVALRHHPPDRGNPASRRRLGQGMGGMEGDRRQFQDR